VDALSSAEEQSGDAAPLSREEPSKNGGATFACNLMRSRQRRLDVKRFFSAVGVLLFLGVAAPVFALSEVAKDSPRADHARRPMIIDDVIRMSQSGVGDEAIIAYVHKYRDRFDINADDVIALNDAHVSRDVVKAMVDESSVRHDDRGREPARYYSGVYVDPWVYPYGYYDPFWYGWGPRFSIGLRFGGGGRFHRGRW
jgi:hypothetical protein